MNPASSLRSVDPLYGTQMHQREFGARMERAQHLNPCKLDHVHRTACYPKDAAGVMIGARP